MGVKICSAGIKHSEDNNAQSNIVKPTMTIQCATYMYSYNHKIWLMFCMHVPVELVVWAVQGRSYVN